jgi:hypothetical protein
LDDLVYKLKEYLSALATKKVGNYRYGYYCGEDLDQKIKEASVLKRSLERIKLSLLRGASCLDDETIQKIVEKAIKIVGKESCPTDYREDISIDTTGINTYLLKGPRCVTYDSYNKFASFICGRLGLTVTAEREQCDITFELTRKIISCNLLYALKVRKELCDLNYRAKADKNQCKIDYKLLLEKTSCDLEYKTYLSFVNRHNLSYPIIEEVYKSGLTLAETEDNSDVVLCTPLNNYRLTEITPTSLEELLNAGFVIELNKHDLKNDYTRY